MPGLIGLLEIAGYFHWCVEIRGFLKHGPRYWRVQRRLRRRAYERET